VSCEATVTVTVTVYCVREERRPTTNNTQVKCSDCVNCVWRVACCITHTHTHTATEAVHVKNVN